MRAFQATRLIRELRRQLRSVQKERNELKNELHELKKSSIVDPLTGIYNYQGFFLLVEDEFPSEETGFLKKQRKVETRPNPGTLVYLDLDNFKTINDSFGHTAGDEALKLFADFLIKNFRRTADVVARTYTGDEFCLYRHGSSDETEVTEDMESIRTCFEIFIEENWNYGRLSFSFGVCANTVPLKTAINISDARMQKDKARRKSNR